MGLKNKMHLLRQALKNVALVESHFLIAIVLIEVCISVTSSLLFLSVKDFLSSIQTAFFISGVREINIGKLTGRKILCICYLTMMRKQGNCR
jgi:hypothetical protein